MPRCPLPADLLLPVDGHVVAPQVKLDRRINHERMKRCPDGEDDHVDSDKSQDDEREFPIGEVLSEAVGTQEHEIEAVVLDKQGAEHEHDSNIIQPHNHVAEEEVEKVVA